LRSEEACRALAAAEVQYLEPDLCRFIDGGTALLESVREGRGPKGFHLERVDDEDDDDVDG
jgi:hypothetical protein